MILYLGVVPELGVLGPLPSLVPCLLISAMSITTLVCTSVSSSVSGDNSTETITTLSFPGESSATELMVRSLRRINCLHLSGAQRFHDSGQ